MFKGLLKLVWYSSFFFFFYCSRVFTLWLNFIKWPPSFGIIWILAVSGRVPQTWLPHCVVQFRWGSAVFTQDAVCLSEPHTYFYGSGKPGGSFTEQISLQQYVCVWPSLTSNLGLMIDDDLTFQSKSALCLQHIALDSVFTLFHKTKLWRDDG